MMMVTMVTMNDDDDDGDGDNDDDDDNDDDNDDNLFHVNLPIWVGDGDHASPSLSARDLNLFFKT